MTTTTTTTTYTPVAGCSPVSHSDAAAYHRRWLLVDAESRWISDPEVLARIEPDIRFGYLVLQAPGMLRLDVPLDVIEDDDSVRLNVVVGSQNVDAVDEGDVAATWASACLGITCRLVKVHPDAAPVQWPA